MPIVAEAEELGHCAAAETVVFSCVIGAKLASVCAGANAKDQAKYLQYRYGVLGHPEILLPPTNRPPGYNTAAMSYLNPIGDGNGYIRFKSGQYSYIVYAFSSRQSSSPKGSAPGWDNWHGVLIEGDGKIRKALRCRPFFGVQSSIEPTFLAKQADFLVEDQEDILERVMDAVTISK